MASFQDANPEAWARGRARAAANGDSTTDEAPTPAWDDLGGNPDNVRPLPVKPPPVDPEPDTPRPRLSDRSRQIIADTRRRLRGEEP